MRKYVLLILSMVMIPLLSGTVFASENDDTGSHENIIDTISDIKDLFDLLDMVRKNKEDLDYLQEDPTNQTRMVEGVENTVNRGMNLLLGADPTDTYALTKRVEFLTYMLVVATFFSLFMTAIFGKR
jgi:hypothetical protein